MTGLASAGLWVAVVTAAVFDVRTRRIPDWLTLGLAFGALGLRLGLGGLDLLVPGLLGALVCGGWFGLFAVGRAGLGWGDVKLACGVGAALGWPLAVPAVVFTSGWGAAQAVFLLIWQGGLSATVARVMARGATTAATGKQVPYGVAIALGAVSAVVWDGNVF